MCPTSRYVVGKADRKIAGRENGQPIPIRSRLAYTARTFVQ